MEKFSISLNKIILIGFLLLVVSCDSPGDPDAAADGSASAAACLKLDLLSQVGCFADIAVNGRDFGLCRGATHAGVRYQCYAVVAERIDDSSICQQIPSTTAEHLMLKDLCLSDIAKNRLDSNLCDPVEAAGVRDGCFFDIANRIPDRTLCIEITDEALKLLCDEGPSR